MTENPNRIKLIEESHTLAMTFADTAKNRIGKYYKWTCQGIEHNSCHLSRTGRPARYQDGYMVSIAHWREEHGPEGDTDWHKGRVLCQTHHAMEELQRGNVEGAKILLEEGIFHTNHLKEFKVQQMYRSLADVYELMIKERVPLRLCPDLSVLYDSSGSDVFSWVLSMD